MFFYSSRDRKLFLINGIFANNRKPTVCCSFCWMINDLIIFQKVLIKFAIKVLMRAWFAKQFRTTRKIDNNKCNYIYVTVMQYVFKFLTFSELQIAFILFQILIYSFTLWKIFWELYETVMKMLKKRRLFWDVKILRN